MTTVLAGTVPPRETAPAVSATGVTRRGIIPGLNGIRALAAFGILLEHTMSLTLSPDTPLSNPLRAPLVIFVVLSGFLNYRPWVVAHLRNEDPPDTRTYVFRRMLRVFPLYWAVLAVYLVVRGFGEISSVVDMAKVVFLLQTFDKRLVFSGVGPAWTLSVEFTFYLMLPLFFRFVRWAARWLGASDMRGRVRGQLAVVGLFWLIGPTYRMLFGVGERYITDVPSCADMLATGMLMAIASAWWSEGGQLPRPMVRWVNSPWATPVAVAVSMAVFIAISSPLPPLKEAPAYLSVFRIFAALALGATLIGISFLAPERHPVRRFLSARWLQSIAVLSFGIYLWHVMVIDELVDLIGGYSASKLIPLTFTTLMFSGTLAALTFVLVQQPFEVIRRRIRFPVRSVRRRPDPPPRRSPFALPAAATDMAPLAGYRAVAATLVVVGHVVLAARIEQDHHWVSPFHAGAVVVPLFFGLAGYVSYRPFVTANLTGGTPPTAGRFIWKRVVRIYFLYLMALTIYLLAVPFFRPDTFLGYLQLYTLTQVYDPSLLQKGLPAAWFEAALFPLYMLMPAFAIAARRIAARRGVPTMRDRVQAEVFVCVSIIAVSVICRTALIAGQVAGSTTWPVAYADFVGIGMLTALASVWVRGGGRLPSPVEAWRRHPNVSFLVLVLAIAIFELVDPPVNGPFTLNMQLFRFTGYFVMVAALVVPAVLSGPRYWLNRLMATFPMVVLGVGSYSTYLWHQLVLVAIAVQFGSTVDRSMLWPFLFVGLVLSHTVGLISSVVLEAPLASLKNVDFTGRSRRGGRAVPVPSRAAPAPTRPQPSPA